MIAVVVAAVVVTHGSAVRQAAGTSRGATPGAPPAYRCGSPRVLAAAAAGVLTYAFAQFVLDGLGTPAPPVPTDRLVVSGLYGYLRNPTYLAVLASSPGMALLLSRPVLLACAAVVGDVRRLADRSVTADILAAR